MADYLWLVTDNYMSMDPEGGRDTNDSNSNGLYNSSWMIPSSQYENLDKADKKKFLKLRFFFQDGIKDPTGREVYLIDVEDDIAEVYAYQGSKDLGFTFEIGPGNSYLNYYGVDEDFTTWKEMKENVEIQRNAGEPPAGTFTVEKFVTEPADIKKLWEKLKKSEKQMKEPYGAETNFSAEGVEHKFALIAKYPDSEVTEATWEKTPEGMETIEKTHVTLVGGKALKEFKKQLKVGTKEVIAAMPEPPTPELGQTGVAKRTMGDGEIRETYFMEIGNQEDFQDYADKLCDALGIANPEPNRYFHVSVANNHGGNPFKSVGDITESDLHGFAAEDVPLGYYATLAADGETIVVQPDKWLAETFGLAAPLDAYSYAYGDGFRDGTKIDGVYAPRLEAGKERDLFRDSYKYKARRAEEETQ
tara:strand:+ start:304 stop:1554 length:1251 start_codon:yes stop_codon:yes gene_type:complete